MKYQSTRWKIYSAHHANNYLVVSTSAVCLSEVGGGVFFYALSG